MFPGDFSRLCKKLNSRIWFSYNANNLYKNAGIYCDEEHICGVPANEVPEHTVKTPDSIIARGWRDIFKILLARKVIKERDLIKELRKRGHTWKK